MGFQFIKSASFELLSSLVAYLGLVDHLLYRNTLRRRWYTWSLMHSRLAYIIFELIKISRASLEGGPYYLCPTSSPAHFHDMRLHTSKIILKLWIITAHIPLYV